MQKHITVSKNGLLEFLFIIGGIAVLFPFFYLISKAPLNINTFILYVLILYPTLAALINGAPFVPTPMKAVEKMVKAAKLKEGYKVYDIGCGDGRIVHLASKQKNIKAIGYELSPFVYILAIIRKIFWKSKAKILFKNFKHHNFSDADVIFCYLLPDTLAKLTPKLYKELKPGARIISYAFPIAEWQEIEKIEKDPQNNISHIWIYEKQ